MEILSYIDSFHPSFTLEKLAAFTGDRYIGLNVRVLISKSWWIVKFSRDSTVYP